MHLPQPLGEQNWYLFGMRLSYQGCIVCTSVRIKGDNPLLFPLTCSSNSIWPPFLTVTWDTRHSGPLCILQSESWVSTLLSRYSTRCQVYLPWQDYTRVFAGKPEFDFFFQAFTSSRSVAASRYISLSASEKQISSLPASLKSLSWDIVKMLKFEFLGTVLLVSLVLLLRRVAY